MAKDPWLIHETASGYGLFYGCPTMTDAAQERVDEQTNAERHKKAVREWSDDELTRAARNQAGRLDEAGQFGVADLLYELTRRLRARQREGEREPER